MFNTKRIIFLIGLLSLVALTGALMAGPAFAGNGNEDPASKTLLCHWNSEDSMGAGDDGFLGTEDDVVVEAMGWYIDEVDDKSAAKHIRKHGDVEIGSATAGIDGELGTEDDGVYTEGSCTSEQYYQGDNRDDDDGRA